MLQCSQEYQPLQDNMTIFSLFPQQQQHTRSKLLSMNTSAYKWQYSNDAELRNVQAVAVCKTALQKPSTMGRTNKVIHAISESCQDTCQQRRKYIISSQVPHGQFHNSTQKFLSDEAFLHWHNHCQCLWSYDIPVLLSLSLIRSSFFCLQKCSH